MSPKRLTTEEINRLSASMADNPVPEPRSRLTSDDLERMMTPIGTPYEGPSRVGSVARGALNRAGEIAGSAGEWVYNNLSMGPAFSGPPPAPGSAQTPFDRRGGRLDVGPEVARTTGAGADAIGARAATDSTGRALETAGEYMADAALFAPSVALGAPALGISALPAVAAEVGAAGLGGFLDGTLREEGSPGAGAIAGLAASAIAAPLGGGSISKADDAGRAAYRAVTQMTEDAIPYMEKLGVTRDSLVKASSEIKREVPDVAAAINQLRQVGQRTQGIPGGASTRQAFETMDNNRGGSGISHMSEQLSKTDKEYRRNAALRRADFLDYLGREWDNLVEVDPDYPAFLAKYDSGKSALKQEERAAWSLVRENEQPLFDIKDVRDKAADIIDDAVYKRHDVPKVLKDLIDEEITPSDTVGLGRFQELRSVLLGVVRDAKLQPSSQNDHAKAMASQLLELLQKNIDDWSKSDTTGKSLEYLNARRLTAQNADLYNPNSPIISALDKGGQSRSLFAQLRNAKGKTGARTSPADEARRLVRVAEQTPGGMENLKSLAIEDLFYDGLVPTATRTPSKVMAKNEEMYRVILGDQYDNAVELLDLSRLATAGKEGTAAQVSSVGSGVAPAKFLFGLARSATDPIGAAVENAMSQMGKQTKREVMWQAIVREALEDPKFMQVLLEMPTERSLPAWKVQWTRLISKSSARAAARSEARRRTKGGEKP